MKTVIGQVVWNSKPPLGSSQREHNRSIVPYLEDAVRTLERYLSRSPTLLNLQIWCDVHVFSLLVELPESHYRPKAQYSMRLRYSFLSALPACDANTFLVPITPTKPNVWIAKDDGRLKTLEVMCGGDVSVLIYIANATDDRSLLGRR